MLDGEFALASGRGGLCLLWEVSGGAIVERRCFSGK